MTETRYKQIKRKLAIVTFTTLDIAFVVVVVAGLWQFIKTQ
jgi:hypothetical protein